MGADTEGDAAMESLLLRLEDETVPDADALGAGATIPTVTMLITRSTAAAGDTIRRASREKTIPRLLFRVASSALQGGTALRQRGRGGQHRP